MNYSIEIQRQRINDEYTYTQLHLNLHLAATL